MSTLSRDIPTTFQEVYPKAPFAELIRLSLALTDGIVSLRHWLTRPSLLSAGSSQPVVR